MRAVLVLDLLRCEALDGIARVIHAPLQGDPPWYAATALDALPADVDLLVVDGPRRTRRGSSTAAPQHSRSSPRGPRPTQPSCWTIYSDRGSASCSPDGKPSGPGASGSTTWPASPSAPAASCRRAQRPPHVNVSLEPLTLGLAALGVYLEGGLQPILGLLGESGLHAVDERVARGTGDVPVLATQIAVGRAHMTWPAGEVTTHRRSDVLGRTLSHPVYLP